MRDRTAHWESNFAKLCILRDSMQDRGTCMYVLAYLVAPLDDAKLDEVIDAMREFQQAAEEPAELKAVHDPRD